MNILGTFPAFRRRLIYAPLPITEKSIAGILTNPDNEVRLVAQIDGEIVGVGALVLEKSELRACYVAPGASRTRCFPYQVLPVKVLMRPLCVKSGGSRASMV